MKREFLANLKVGDQPLPKEIIDTILDENSRDIGATKAQYADYDDLKGQLSTANNTIAQLQAQQQGDGLVDGKNAQQWKDAHDQAVAAHKKELEGVNFQHTLNAAITGARGKNTKAITALLDVDALRESEDQPKAINDALEALKKENGYLFDSDKLPPRYAPNTGVGAPPPEKPATLADALRERFTK